MEKAEAAIAVTMQETSVRAKLTQILLIADRKNMKAVIECCDNISGVVSSSCCRYCEATIDPRDGVSQLVLTGISACCVNADCVRMAKDSCVKTHKCGHACYGVRDELVCLPCLLCPSPLDTITHLKQDSKDECMICYSGSLGEQPCIQVDCGHVFHMACARKLLLSKWVGPQISVFFKKMSVYVCIVFFSEGRIGRGDRQGGGGGGG